LIIQSLSPNLLLFSQLKYDKKKNHNQKTKKFRSYIENKQKFMHVQMALGISGEQINIVGV
jgi:hypothetical protein